jgi:hypothetical protein
MKRLLVVLTVTASQAVLAVGCGDKKGNGGEKSSAPTNKWGISTDGLAPTCPKYINGMVCYLGS